MPRRRLDGISCPICRKLVLPLDENGCMIDGCDMVTCRHYIGMADDYEVPTMEKGFEDFERLLRLLRHTVDYESDPSLVAATLASLLPGHRRTDQLDRGLARSPAGCATSLPAGSRCPS